MYIIKDWAGNILFDGLEFESFECAWDYLYDTFPHKDGFDDFFVESK